MLNCCGADEHVPEIERYIRTVKDRTRSTYRMLPFRRLPRIVLIHLLKNAVLWLNALLAADGVSSQHSPRYLMTGRELTYDKHVRLEIRCICSEEHSNNMRERTTGAICLGPTGNAQGGHWFMSLATGSRISRHHWTELPMPAEAIQRVSAIGRAQNMPPTLTFADRHGHEMPQAVAEVHPDDMDDDSDGESYTPSDSDDDSTVHADTDTDSDDDDDDDSDDGDSDDGDATSHHAFLPPPQLDDPHDTHDPHDGGTSPTSHSANANAPAVTPALTSDSLNSSSDSDDSSRPAGVNLNETFEEAREEENEGYDDVSDDVSDADSDPLPFYNDESVSLADEETIIFEQEDTPTRLFDDTHGETSGVEGETPGVHGEIPGVEDHGLSLQTLRQNPPVSLPMVKGHMDQIRQNVRSTKVNFIEPDLDEPAATNTDVFHPEAIGEKSNNCFVSVLVPTGQIYTDQTGRFVTPSSNGNNYLMVLYDYDSNHIFAQPFRNRTATCILNAFKTLHKRLCLAGCRPKLHRLDNECSTILKEFLSEENIKYQLVPPLVHRRNSAERAIRTFANHFIAGLCSVDKDFPIHLWDHLVPQALPLAF
eukprot:scaffold2537_cov102-Cylindrotheca_fusiformis.AAC.1